MEIEEIERNMLDVLVGAEAKEQAGERIMLDNEKYQLKYLRGKYQ